MLLNLTKRSSNSIALTDGDCSFTYEELIQTVQQIQTHAKSLDLKQTIAIETTQNSKFIALFIALMCLGKNICLVSGNVQSSLLKKFDISVIITVDPKNPSDIDISDFFRPTSKIESLIDISEKSSTLIFSSGTTARPKLILSKTLAHISSARNAINALNLDKRSKYLLSLPTNHISGIAPIFRSLIAGSTLVIDYSFNHDPVRSILEHQITHLSCVATQLKRFLASPLNEIHSLKALLIGGSKVSKELIKSAYEKHLPIFLSYGLTETNSMICCNNVLKSKNFTSSGKPFDNVKVSLTAKSHIKICSEVLYEEQIFEDGTFLKRESWFETSDVGFLDKENNLYISHRSDDVFISGGYNINPTDIKIALEKLSNIEKACVIPAEHKEFGISPIAFYHSKSPINEKKIQKALKKLLNFYQIPKKVIPWSFENLDTDKVSSLEKAKMLDHFQNLNKGA